MRACASCGESLEGRSLKAIYCSKRCGLRVRNGIVVNEDPCAHCGAEIVGRRGSAIYCSVACNDLALIANRSAKKWEGVDPARPCESCGEPLMGKRPHARFCGKSCKGAASTLRRESDGRGSLRRHARRAARSFAVTPCDISKMLVRQRGVCAYCPSSILVGFHRDHVVPISRGGDHSVGNLVLTCANCNLSKGAMLLSEWRHSPRVRVGVIQTLEH